MRRVHVSRRDFAEDVEIRDAARCCPGAHGGDEGTPEGGVDMLRRVDAVAVDAEAVDPCAVDIDHPRDHRRILGEQIVEADEIALLRAFALEGRISAIVVIDRVVEPGWDLDAALGGGDADGVGVIGVGQPREIGRAAVILAGEAGVDRSAGEAAAALVGIVGDAAVGAVVVPRAFGQLDDVGGVVGDDVHIDFHPPRMGGGDQRGEVGIGAEVRIDAGEVGHPIAVIARALAPRRALHRLVDENRRDPDGSGAEPLDIVEPARDALEVAAMVKALGGGIEAGVEPVALDPAAIVARVAIVEAVGEEEIDHLVLRQARADVAERDGGQQDRRRSTGRRHEQGRAECQFQPCERGFFQQHFLHAATMAATKSRWVAKVAALAR